MGYEWDFNGTYPLVNVNKQLLKMAIEIVDFPMKNGDVPWQNVSSPEGILMGLLHKKYRKRGKTHDYDSFYG